jgi:hypothetical protein
MTYIELMQRKTQHPTPPPPPKKEEKRKKLPDIEDRSQCYRLER